MKVGHKFFRRIFSEMNGYQNVDLIGFKQVFISYECFNRDVLVLLSNPLPLVFCRNHI